VVLNAKLSFGVMFGLEVAAAAAEAVRPRDVAQGVLNRVRERSGFVA